MKKVLLILCLSTAPAFAQQQSTPTSVDYYKQTVANCVADSANLFEQANKFAAEVNQLKAKIAELEKKLGDKPEGQEIPARPNRPTGRPGGMPQ